MSSRFIHTVVCVRIFFFWGCWIILYCMNTSPFSLSIHLLLDIWAAFILCLQWMMLPWTLVYKHLFKNLFLILLGIYPEVELLGHPVILCLTSGWTTGLFFHNSCTVYIPTTDAQVFLFLCLPPILVFCFVDSRHSNGYEVVYLLVVLICVSLMINDVEHLFNCLLTTFTSPLEICLFNSFLNLVALNHNIKKIPDPLPSV